MNILIIGYGKMGKGIETLALNKGHSIVGIIDLPDLHLLNNSDYIRKIQPDLAIEFTTPDGAWPNIKTCLEQGIPTLSGTTGWTHHWDDLHALINKVKGRFFYTANYSIGVNIFFTLNKLLAQLMAKQPSYQLCIEETHHIHKKDKPSGTALQLAQDVLAIHPAYDHWSLTSSPPAGSIPIHCIREGEVPGTHTLYYNGLHDRIVISHEAFSREGFIQGVLIAAEWLFEQRSPGIFNMQHILK